MARDWARLGAAIRDARDQRGWSQIDLATRSGLSRKTIQDLESGHEYQRIPGSVLAVERALGWQPGRAAAILGGSDQSDPGRGRMEEELADRLPLTIVETLESGRIVDSMEMTTPAGLRLVMVAVRDLARPAPTPELRRAQTEEWRRALAQVAAEMDAESAPDHPNV